MVRLLISTGEVSGDLQGSLLIHALRAEAERRQLPLDLLPAADHLCRFLAESIADGRRGPMPALSSR